MDGPPAFDAKEQVRQAVDIVDLVGDALPLRRQGRIYVTTCPWHDDSRPSLQVNPERQSWKCWVCDIGGDIFSWVMRNERVEFREALEILAERAGIEFSMTGPAPKPGGLGDKRAQLTALKWAAEQFAACLAHDPAAAPARQYLEERGIIRQSIERFQIGFSPPDWEWLVRRGEKVGHSPKMLERVGVAGERTGGGGFYDRFRGRVIFPISDRLGNTIAFGGRILPELADDRSAKYINSPETQRYHKHKELYALNLAKEVVGTHDPLVVMEGYTDVIMAHQHGIESAVAVCGTALGSDHLKTISQLTDRVCLVLDGDEAGQRRTDEVLGMFVAGEVDLRILSLPQGDDPFDFIKREGGTRFTELVQLADDALNYKLKRVIAGVGSLDDTHAVSRAAEELLATLATVPLAAGESGSQTILREQQIVSRIARQLRLPMDQLRERLSQLRRSQSSRERLYDAPNEYTESQPAAASMLAFEQEIFELLLIDPAVLIPILREVTMDDLSSPVARDLFACCIDLKERGEAATFERIMLSLDNEQAKNRLVALDESAQQKSASDREQRLDDLLTFCRRRRQQHATRQSLAALGDQRVDPEHKEQLLSDLFEKLRREKGSLPTDG